MNYKFNGLAGVILLMVVAISCNRGPKVIAPENANVNGVSESGIFSDNKLKKEASEVSDDVHKVVVQEVLPTSKYIYARVTEGDEEFWVATTKKEVEVGATYYFRDGLLKLNFESKEYNRVFDKVYLVGSLVSSSHGQEAEKSTSESEPEADQNESRSGSPEIVLKEGSISIAELIGNKDKYEGKSVQLTGKCVKINANILGRNWIHLKDGSMDSYDLVVTSDKIIPEGKVVTMTGSVVLNKDFGAGYKYEIIVEDGELIKD